MKATTTTAMICIALAGTAAGCASVETKLPVPDPAMLKAESDMQESHAFERYMVMSQRLDRVSSTILLANAELCEKTRIDTGLITHSVKSYPKELRAGATRWLGAQETPLVFLVRENGPAAGKVVSGAELRGEHGKVVSAGSAKVQARLVDGGAIDVKNPGGETVSYSPPHTLRCDYQVKLKFSGAVNAYATGKTITVTTGMMDFVKNDDELALVVGHELAHNTLRHVRKSIQNMLLSGFATRYTRPFEAEADYVGLYYMARAGYSLDEVDLFWRRLGTKHPKSIVTAKTHPMTPSRLLSIRMSADEIQAKRAAGQPLVPNYIKARDDN